MNKLFFTFLTLILTVHLHAQLEFTSYCQDTTIQLPATACSYSNFSISAAAETDCADNNISFNFEIDLENDGIIDATGSSSNIITDLPIGVHNITFFASDPCSQVDSCEIIIQVIDTIPPNVALLPGIQSVILPLSGELLFNVAQLVDVSGFDNCIPFEDITFSFTTNPADTIIDIFSYCCITPDGLIPLTIYATDQSGNTSFSSTFLNMQDPNAMCGCVNNNTISFCNTPDDEPIMDVTYTYISILGDTILFPNINFSLWNTQLGDKLIPSKNQSPLNGVTTYDLVLISKHILGLEIFDSPYKIIAADANQSGEVTALDMVTIRSLILHVRDEFPSGQSWVFDPPFHLFDNIQCDPIQFTGVKLGDVNFTVSPDSLQNNQTETRTPDGILNFIAKNKNLKKEKLIPSPCFLLILKIFLEVNSL